MLRVFCVHRGPMQHAFDTKSSEDAQKGAKCKVSAKTK